MSNNTALGAALTIDDSVLKKIAEAELKVQDLEKQVWTSSQNIKASFRDMGDKGVQYFINKLQLAQQELNKINMPKIDFSKNVNFGQVGQQATELANSVTKVSVAINKIGNVDNQLNPKNSVLAWQGLQKNIEQLEKRQQDLIKVTKDYENTLTRIQSGKGGVLTQDMQSQYKAAQAELAANKQLIESYRQKQQAIINYQAEQRKQIENAQALRNFESQQSSLPEQRKAEELRKMNEYYRELEKISKRQAEQAAKDAEKEAAARKKAEEATRRQMEAENRRRANNIDKQNTAALTAYNRAMAASEGTVTQRINKIAKLKQAEEQLSRAQRNSSQEITKIKTEIERLTKANEAQAASYSKVQKSQSSLINTSDQLARKLALIFSVSQIQGYVNKLIEVRGEFELQNTALASILQNKDKADRLFAQITELAVQSPFTIRELATYTKSLSAYSVEYEKLYDTTKMLADVSAGLGVDMQRLILAFGQVKAANFLRGTETRQFTEAGINMLGELAKYYSELEGRIVSVGEVQDRQFKRMISFGDVEQVFKRLTSAGGMFYQMQERQADTLAGMMSNLNDRISVMLNTIGKENEGAIKGTIKVVQSLVSNYDAVVNTIKASVAAFGAYKVAVLLSKQSLIEFAATNGIVSSAAVKQLTLIQLLRVGLTKLSVSIKSVSAAFKSLAVSNPWLLALTAILTALYEVITWNDEYNEQLDEINKKHNENAASLNRIAEAYDKISQKAKQASKDQTNFAYSQDDFKSLFAQLRKLDEQLKDRGYSLPVRIELVTPQNIDEVFKGGSEILRMANEFGSEFNKALSSGMTSAEGWFNIFGDNLGTDLKELSDAYSEVGGAFKANLDVVENEVTSVSDRLVGSAKEYYKELKAGRKENENEVEWTLRRVDLLGKIRNLSNDLIIQNRIVLESDKELNDLISKRIDIKQAEKEAQYELNKILDEIIDKYGGIENLKKAYNDNPLIIKTEIDRAFEKLELNAQAKRFASFWSAQRLQIPIEFETKAKMPTFFNDFRDTVKTLDTKGIFSKTIESVSDLTGLEEMLQKKYKEIVKDEEVLNRANTKRLNLTKQIEAEKKKLSSTNKDEADAAQITLNNLEKQKSVIDQTIESSKKKNAEAKTIIKDIASAYNLNYLSDKNLNKEQKTTEQVFKERLEFFERANSEYEKLLKNYSKEEAKAKILKSMQDEANQRGVGGIFMSAEFDEKGTLKSLDRVKAMYQSLSEDMRIEFAKAFGGIKLDMDIKVRENRIKAIQDQFSELFGNYELSLELDKLGLDKDLMSQLFNVDVFDLSELRKRIEPFKTELQKTLGTDGVSAWDKINKQISDAEAKELQDRLKTYSKYLKKSVSERVSIEMESQKKISEVRNMKEFTPEQKEAITQNIKSETQKDLDKLSWKEFQQTDMYLQLFEDLEYVSTSAINSMLDKLASLRDSLKNLPPEDLKEINKQMRQLEEIKIKRNPFEFLFSKDVKESSMAWQEMGNILNEISSAATDIASSLENVFGTMDDKTADIVSSFSEIASGMGNTASGVGRIMAGDWIGGGLQALTGLTSTIGSIFAIGDKKKEREIQRQIKQVEKLQKAYEKLEKAIDSAFSIDTLEKSTDQAIANLEAQNEALQKSIAAEQDKKKTDDNRIKEWEEQIEANTEEINEILKEQVSQVTDGIFDDLLSAASDFTSAWLESFKEVGDGMQGLEDSFQEMLSNMVQKQATMLITSTFLDNWKKHLENYINADDLELTSEEAKKWVDSVKQDLPALNKALEEYFKAMGEAGLDLSGEQGDTMSGLQKGIQSITEEAAQALEALLNSVRYFVSDSNLQLRNILTTLNNPAPENPYLLELKAQTEQLRAMNSLWNSLTKTSPGKGKVLKMEIV